MSKEELKNITDEAQAKYGKGIISWASEYDDVKVVPTGILSLDRILTYGGLPGGRFIEISGSEGAGKSTLTYQIISAVQKAKGNAIIYDTEQRFFGPYAKNCGVKIDAKTLPIIHAQYAEQGLQICEDYIRSGTIDLAIIDSSAGLVPKDEVEGTMSDQQMGLQARIIGKALRKLLTPVAESESLVIFVNQIRMKVGVVFGCFQGDTKVVFSNGAAIPIKKVVENKIKGKVLCYDDISDSFVESEIVDWHINGKVNTNHDFIHFTCGGISGRGRQEFCCTPAHKILTDNGWLVASKIEVGDVVSSVYKEALKGELKQIVLGTLCGDGQLTKHPIGTAAIRVQNNEQPEYLKWKLKKLARLNFKQVNAKKPYFVSEYRHDLKKLRDKIYTTNYRSPLKILNELDELGLAIWYMDDGYFKKTHKIGSISVKRITSLEGEAIVENFTKRGFTCHYSKSQRALVFTVKGFAYFSQRIKKYVPEVMQYKLLPEHRNQYIDFKVPFVEDTKRTLVKVLHKKSASDRRMRNPYKYDITVKGYHNYLVGGNHNGVIVHNSPETTPGGRALRFFSSVRLDLRRQEILKEKGEPYGIVTKVKVVKGMGGEDRTTTYRSIFDRGVDLAFDLREHALEAGVLTKSGSIYKFEDKSWRGKKYFADDVLNDKDLYNKIYTMTRQELKIGEI